MKRKHLVTIALVAGMACTGLVFSPAQAAAFQCTGYNEGTINNAVKVPGGSTCNLQGATVNGNVTVKNGGRLIIGGTSTVNGNVTSDTPGTDSDGPFGYPFSIILCNTHVTGMVDIQNAPSRVVVGGGGCGGNAIDGGLLSKNNKGGVEVVGNAPNSVGGSCPIEQPPTSGLGVVCGFGNTVTVKKSKGLTEYSFPPYDSSYATNESAAVGYNVIQGDLVCTDNAGGVTDISQSSDSNTVSGTKTGQCANLGPA